MEEEFGTVGDASLSVKLIHGVDDVLVQLCVTVSKATLSRTRELAVQDGHSSASRSRD
jgi:hypothetical protein